MKPTSTKAVSPGFAKTGFVAGLATVAVVLAGTTGLWSATARAQDDGPTMILGAEFELSGYVAGEFRGFLDAPALPGQDDRRFEPSLILQPEFRLYWDRERLTFIPYYHYDPADTDGRTHGDIRDLSVYIERDSWDTTLGISKVFWGVVESRHLVDIINQTDLVEDIDGEDKLGQPMVNARWFSDYGTIGAFVLPGFRERTFPSASARLRGFLPVDTDNPIYKSSAEENHVDGALRYSNTFGDWDVGASYFHGTGREPVLVQSVNANGEPVFRPKYDIIGQAGLDVQATLDTWLWKLEAIHRSGQGDAFLSASGGFEYTFFGLNDGYEDLGLLLEYHYDGRSEGAPVTIFDNDIFAGARLALNDEAATELLGGFIIDQRTQETQMTFEAERRITETWFAGVEARLFLNADEGSTFDKESHAILRISRYF